MEINFPLLIIVTFVGTLLILKLLNHRGGNVDSRRRREDFDSRQSEDSQEPIQSNLRNRFFVSEYFPFDKKTILWCANFLQVDESDLMSILRNGKSEYSNFRIGKRSGGYRTISAPSQRLLSVQKTINERILNSVHVHPAARGFRQNMSVLDNAKDHLGKPEVLKVDITDFFGSIKYKDVRHTFQRIGYSSDISLIFARLCVFGRKLPQGGATSPALSNIIAYQLDEEMAEFAKDYQLTYTRYADDLTFSGENIKFEECLSIIEDILDEFDFQLQRKKTRMLRAKDRKIITGVSISSGYKMTVPKAMKREIRKNVHFITKRGLREHQNFIGSTDPAYLKRLIGQLNYWRMVEPDNHYVIDSIARLKKY